MVTSSGVTSNAAQRYTRRPLGPPGPTASAAQASASPPALACTAASSLRSARRMIRETCIWETPRRRPISYWFRSSSKRSSSTRRSRSSSWRLLGGELSLDRVVARLGLAQRLDDRRRHPGPLCFWAPRATACDAPRRPAGPPRPPPRRGPGARRSGRPSGLRPSSSLSSAAALCTAIVRSWSPLGRRTSQTRSRKWRRSSPRMVGAA